MTKVLSPASKVLTVADLLKGLGNIPPERVWFRPVPGTATEQAEEPPTTQWSRSCP